MTRLEGARRIVGTLALTSAILTGHAEQVRAVDPSPAAAITQPSTPENSQSNPEGLLIVAGLFALGAFFKVKDTVELRRIANHPNSEAIIEEQLKQAL